MRRAGIIRIALDALLFMSVFVLPWWGTLGLALVLVALYTAYEVVLAGVLRDLLYATDFAPLGGVEFVMTIALCALLIASVLIRRTLRVGQWSMVHNLSQPHR